MVSYFDGKTVIVTGAARSVGLAAARRFHELGASVMMADHDEKCVAREAKELDKGSGRVAFFKCAPTERLDLNNLLAATADAFSRVDVVVNGAARNLEGTGLNLESDAFDEAMTHNARSTFLLIRLAAEYMMQQNEEDARGGAIVNISSLDARQAIPGRFALGVSMAAVEQMTRSFAVDLAPHRIRVNAVAAGGMTGRWAGLLDTELREAVEKRTPMNRLAEPDEIANCVAFLASEEASFVTGQVLCVDGGRSAYDFTLPGSGDKSV